jgi:hypothetical protein
MGAMISSVSAMDMMDHTGAMMGTGSKMMDDTMKMAHTGTMMEDTMKMDAKMMDKKDMMMNDTMKMDKKDMKKDMMKKDDMMKMDHKDMMKDGKKMDLTKMSVAKLAEHCGYNWKKDRKMLAEKAGIKNYTGTKKQNMKIQKYLLDMAKTMGM